MPAQRTPAQGAAPVRGGVEGVLWQRDPAPFQQSMLEKAGIKTMLNELPLTHSHTHTCSVPSLRQQAMLEKAGVKTMLNELSSTVVFERPREEAFVRKWQLACEGDIAHVVVMPNITVRKLETFVQELFESR